MKFEWDEDKSEANIRKHGLDFTEGRELFLNSGLQPFLIRADLTDEYPEERWQGLGTIQGRVVAVVFTERQPDLIRFISLRKATRKEQRIYEKTIQNTMGSH